MSVLNAIIKFDENIIQNVFDKNDERLKVYIKHLSGDILLDNILCESLFC